MRQKRLFQILVTAVLLTALAEPLAAQEDIYVDAPIETIEETQQRAAAAQVMAAGNFKNQFSWGLINYGFAENVHYQYSGDSIFDGGNSPSSLLNIGWMRIVPLDYKYLPGISYGSDFTAYSMTSEEAYAGDEESVTGPSIDMAFYLLNLNLRLYFMDPVVELLHPFFGVSWGIIFGDFNTTKVGGSKHTTNLLGMAVTRNVGVEVKIGDRGGLVFEFRTVTANSVATSNDPFNRSSGDSMDLDFSGITIALTGYYRF